jgi:hypothetical protein
VSHLNSDIDQINRKTLKERLHHKKAAIQKDKQLLRLGISQILQSLLGQIDVPLGILDQRQPDIEGGQEKIHKSAEPREGKKRLPTSPLIGEAPGIEMRGYSIRQGSVVGPGQIESY